MRSDSLMFVTCQGLKSKDRVVLKTQRAVLDAGISSRKLSRSWPSKLSQTLEVRQGDCLGLDLTEVVIRCALSTIFSTELPSVSKSREDPLSNKDVQREKKV